MTHAQSYTCRAVWVGTKSLLVKSQSTSVIFLIESNTCFTKEGRDVILALVQHEIELSICLVHLVTFQQAEVRTTQEMVLKNTMIKVRHNTKMYTVVIRVSGEYITWSYMMILSAVV